MRYSFTDLSETEIVKQNNNTYNNIYQKWIETSSENLNFDLHDKCYKLFTSQLNGNKIIDMGCGPGIESKRFFKDGYKIFPIDLQEGFVKALKTEMNPLDGIVMDMRYPAIKPDSIDGIFAKASFLHIPLSYSLEILNKFYSILKKGGVLFLHHVASQKSDDGYMVENVLQTENYLICFCMHKNSMSRILKECGFAEIQFFDFLGENEKTKIMKEKYLYSYQVIAVKR